MWPDVVGSDQTEQVLHASPSCDHCSLRGPETSDDRIEVALTSLSGHEGPRGALGHHAQIGAHLLSITRLQIRASRDRSSNRARANEPSSPCRHFEATVADSSSECVTAPRSGPVRRGVSPRPWTQLWSAVHLAHLTQRDQGRSDPRPRRIWPPLSDWGVGSQRPLCVTGGRPG